MSEMMDGEDEDVQGCEGRKVISVVYTDGIDGTCMDEREGEGVEEGSVCEYGGV